MNLIKVIREMGNPLLEDRDEVLALDTRNILDKSVVNTVQEICNLGKLQYSGYHKEVITDLKRSIHDPIKKNCFPHPSPQLKTKEAGKISSLKNSVVLSSHLTLNVYCDATQSQYILHS